MYPYICLIKAEFRKSGPLAHACLSRPFLETAAEIFLELDAVQKDKVCAHIHSKAIVVRYQKQKNLKKEGGRFGVMNEWKTTQKQYQKKKMRLYSINK